MRLLATALVCALPAAAATSETLVETGDVEIVRVLAEPHHKTGNHRHAVNRVMIYLDAGSQTETYADGREVRTAWKAGDALWSGKADTHRVEYHTPHEVRLVKVELQQDGPAGSPPLDAFDPLQVDPEHYAVEFENEQVRVIRVRIPAGETAPMHQHSRKRAVVYLTDAVFEATAADGAVVRSSRKRGDVVWSDQPLKHREINRGPDFEGVVVELK